MEFLTSFLRCFCLNPDWPGYEDIQDENRIVFHYDSRKQSLDADHSPIFVCPSRGISCSSLNPGYSDSDKWGGFIRLVTRKHKKCDSFPSSFHTLGQITYSLTRRFLFLTPLEFSCGIPSITFDLRANHRCMHHQVTWTAKIVIADMLCGTCGKYTNEIASRNAREMSTLDRENKKSVVTPFCRKTSFFYFPNQFFSRHRRIRKRAR